MQTRTTLSSVLSVYQCAHLIKQNWRLICICLSSVLCCGLYHCNQQIRVGSHPTQLSLMESRGGNIRGCRAGVQIDSIFVLTEAGKTESLISPQTYVFSYGTASKEDYDPADACRILVGMS